MRLLRFALKLDAVASGVVGVVSTVGAGVLAGELGVPVAALIATGLVLMAWGVGLWLLVSRRTVSRRLAWTVIGLNLFWAVDSVLLALDWSALTTAGTALVLVQAAAVLVFADLQFLGLRRA